MASDLSVAHDEAKSLRDYHRGQAERFEQERHRIFLKWWSESNGVSDG